MQYIAQVFGIGAMVSLFLIYQQNTRKRLIFCKLSADVFWVLHYLCLGAYSGMIPSFVGIFRETVFLNRESKKWASFVFWPILFICINWALGISVYDRPVDILPIAASTFVTVAFWLKRPLLIKIVSVPVSLTFLIYDFYVGSWIGMANEAFSMISVLIFFIRAGGIRAAIKDSNTDSDQAKEKI